MNDYVVILNDDAESRLEVPKTPLPKIMVRDSMRRSRPNIPNSMDLDINAQYQQEVSTCHPSGTCTRLATHRFAKVSFGAL